MDGYHASFSRALLLSELLDYLAVGWIMELHETRNRLASGLLINRANLYGTPAKP